MHCFCFTLNHSLNLDYWMVHIQESIGVGKYVALAKLGLPWRNSFSFSFFVLVKKTLQFASFVIKFSFVNFEINYTFASKIVNCIFKNLLTGLNSTCSQTQRSHYSQALICFWNIIQFCWWGYQLHFLGLFIVVYNVFLSENIIKISFWLKMLLLTLQPQALFRIQLCHNILFISIFQWNLYSVTNKT